MKTIGLYIHIPFCIKKCAYCDFCSYEGAFHLRKPYIDALIRELSSYKDTLSAYTVDTVYIGGGTPSVLEPSHILKLGDAIRKNITLSDDLEFTFEVNPKSGVKEVLSATKCIGVNRLSIGLQSADDAQLRLLGRSHDVMRFDECFKLARDAGFKNISIDLMTGLPSQSLDSLKASIDYAVSKSPEHISAYALKIEEGTLFHKIYKTLNLPDEDLQSEMYLELVSRLQFFGYKQYEISNFSKDGYYSRHNMRYWTNSEYLGIGASAHSYMNNERFYNTSSLTGYIASVSNAGTAVMEREALTYEDVLEEYIMLRLRLKSGLSYADFYARFGYNFADKFKSRCEQFIDMRLMEDDGKSLRLTSKGFLVSNYIISDLLLEI